MNRVGARVVTASEVLSLIYELLDAHADTIAIGGRLGDELRWQVHLDYLRALQRSAREILAHWHPAAGAVEPK